MSYDLVVWFSKSYINSEQAHQTYKNIMRGDLRILDPDERIGRFLQELILTYPHLYEGKNNDSPWTSDVSEQCAIVHINWQNVDSIRPFIINLALKHYLVCYDPQQTKINLPAHLIRTPKRTRDKPWWKFW